MSDPRLSIQTRVVGDADHLPDAMAGFLRVASPTDEALAVASPRLLAAVRRRLGRDAPVRFEPFVVGGTRPGIAFDDLRRFLDALARRGRAVRAAIHVDGAGRPDRERRAVTRWVDAAPNALAGLPGAMLVLLGDGDERLRLAPPPPPVEGQELPLRLPWDLASVRGAVVAAARRAGLPDTTARDFAMAVNEVSTNAVWHALGPRTATVAVRPDALVCEIRDAGPGVDPLLAHLPPVRPEDGRGFWIAHQLVDSLEVIPDGPGTRVRLEVAVGVPAPAPRRRRSGRAAP